MRLKVPAPSLKTWAGTFAIRRIPIMRKALLSIVAVAVAAAALAPTMANARGWHHHHHHWHHHHHRM
jgi:hypothetical protein